MDNPMELMLKETLSELNKEDNKMKPVAPLVEIHNIHAIRNRGKKDESVSTYDLCDYMTKLVINKTPCEETETFDVMIDFVYSSHKTIEFKTLEDAKAFYDALVAHLMGKSDNHVFDVVAYNGM